MQEFQKQSVTWNTLFS